MNSLVGEPGRVAAVVEAGITVVAERAMYLPGAGGWKTGCVTVGVGE